MFSFISYNRSSSPRFACCFQILSNLARHRFPEGHPLLEYSEQLAKNESDFAQVLKTMYACFIARFHAGMNGNFYWMYDNWL